MSTQTIKSIDELLLGLKEYRNSSHFKFRGQSDTSWKLIPKVGRPPYSKRNDQELFRQWKRRAKTLLNKSNASDLELLTIAQHYGLPTRLLDWSLNPLVAAFFACSENAHKDGVIFIYKTVKTWTPEELNDPFETKSGQVIFIQPDGSSDRLNTQYSYFSLHNAPELELKHIHRIKRIVIPSQLKEEVIFMLNQFGVSNLSIFPDLEGLTKHLCWFYENYEYWDKKGF